MSLIVKEIQENSRAQVLVVRVGTPVRRDREGVLGDSNCGRVVVADNGPGSTVKCRPRTIN